MSRIAFAGMAAVGLLIVLAGAAGAQGYIFPPPLQGYGWGPGPEWGVGPAWGWRAVPPGPWGWNSLYFPPPPIQIWPMPAPSPQPLPGLGPGPSGLGVWPGQINPWGLNPEMAPPFVQRRGGRATVFQ